MLGLRLVVQAGTLLVVARMLGAERFGVFAALAALAVVTGALATAGTHLVMLAEVSRAPERRWAVLAYALPTTLALGLVLLWVYLVLCRYLLGVPETALQVPLLLGIAELVLQPLILLGASEHHALGRIARSQMLVLLPLVMRLLVAVLIAMVAPVRALEAYACGYLLVTAIALWMVLRLLPAPWPALRSWRLPGRAEMRDASGFAAISITKAAPGELDKILAARLLLPGAVGVYAAATRVVAAITLPVTAMTTSALPRLFRGDGGGRNDEGRLLRWMFLAAIGYSLLLAAGVWFAAPVLGWAFGEQYLGIERMVKWLCLAVPGMSLRLVAGNALMAIGRPWVRVAFECIGLLVLLVAAMGMTRHLGTIGMPLALACSEWGMAIAGGLLLRASRRQEKRSVPHPGD
ncbi:oligosaccharide flippase family protein [Stenotrophomonas sp. CPCC 101365]|uniref:Oligosaccharide flippase family protein n=1 Tax=Stenotrophomonas mori TaxID=2871096 RepID=A0ABT0SCX5_9GAMM|nr:oligosaccharide flippase family protein [Stenotrophomonas mori]